MTHMSDLAMCLACDTYAPLDQFGLCDDCADKLERDLIRDRAWDYSATAFGTPADQLEALRKQVIHEYGAAHELIQSPNPRPKNKRSKSRARKRKQAIRAQAVREYTIDDVLSAAEDYIRGRDEDWVNVSRVSQHLYEGFYNLKPKRLGHKSLLKFIEAYPDRFEVRQDFEKRGLYWVRLR